MGGLLEPAIGKLRFATIYFVSLLAGSFGALLVEPDALTVGASGAIFGLFGALIVLERQGTYALGGSVMGLVIINVVFTFAIPNISIGGHLGGLVGGILATFALSHFRDARARSLGPAIVGLIAVASLVVAYVRVESYV